MKFHNRPPVVRERAIEAYFVAQCKVKGILQLKIVSPGRRGVPDRIMHGNPGMRNEVRTAYVELKRPGETPTLVQERMHRIIANQGVTVFVCDDEDSVDKALYTFLL